MSEIEKTTRLLLTQEMADRIVDCVSRGLFDSQTALACGISPNTLRSWVARGIESGAQEPYLSFAERYVGACIEIEGKCVNRILTASADRARGQWSKKKVRQVFENQGREDDGKLSPTGADEETIGEVTVVGDWRAAAWYLERRWPKRWGSTRQPDGGPKEALELPETFVNRQSRARALFKRPTPELVQMFADAGFDLVKRDEKKTG